MTDVLGVCESWGDGEVVLRRERGDLVRVPISDVVAGKPVPPRPLPQLRISAADADRRVVPGWPAIETEPLGDWLLRASGGFSNRANSVLALGDPGLPAEEVLPRLSQWYDARGLRPRAQVVADDPITTVFEQGGWERYTPTTLMLASVSRALRLLPRADVQVRHAPTLDAGWLATDERAAQHGESARHVLESSLAGAEITLATMREDDEVLARGRGAFHDDWLGVSSLWTRPGQRGRGLGTAVLRSLLEWGAERGATTAYLQVVTENSAAIDLYQRSGFRAHHDYVYYAGPAEGQGRQDGR